VHEEMCTLYLSEETGKVTTTTSDDQAE
jgi:hypothetical protein